MPRTHRKDIISLVSTRRTGMEAEIGTTFPLMILRQIIMTFLRIPSKLSFNSNKNLGTKLPSKYLSTHKTCSKSKVVRLQPKRIKFPTPYRNNSNDW